MSVISRSATVLAMALWVCAFGCGARKMPPAGATGGASAGTTGGMQPSPTGVAGTGAAGTGTAGTGASVPPIAGTGGPEGFCVTRTESAVRPAGEHAAAGDVSMLAPAAYETRLTSNTVGLADVDGDGTLDLVVGTRPPFDVPGALVTTTVLLNDGKGTLHPGSVEVAPPGPGSLRLADVTGDGKPDLLVYMAGASAPAGGVGGPGALAVLANAGGGGFAAPRMFEAGPGTLWPWASLPPNPMSVGDVDGDGDLDVAVLSTDGVRVLINQGGGDFGAAIAIATPVYPTAVVIADLNGDRKAEVAFTTAEGLGVVSMNGAAALRGTTPHAVGMEPTALVAGDLDRDGHVDLVVANTSAPGLHVLLNRGDGTLAPSVGYTIKNEACAANAVAIADVDGDGVSDLVTAVGTFGAVNFFLGTGQGTFRTLERSASDKGVRAMALGDLNGDGRADLVTQPYYMNGPPGDTLHVFLSQAP